MQFVGWRPRGRRERKQLPPKTHAQTRLISTDTSPGSPVWMSPAKFVSNYYQGYIQVNRFYHPLWDEYFYQ